VPERNKFNEVQEDLAKDLSEIPMLGEEKKKKPKANKKQKRTTATQHEKIIRSEQQKKKISFDHFQ